VDKAAQIGSDGVVVGEVLGEDGEDGPAMQTARLVQSWHRWVSYVACQGRHSNRPGTAEAGEPAEYRSASKSAAMAGLEEVASAKSMLLSR
jgi:hypothetical protein